ncbi:MAG: alanine/ornithine racemase family PLP-dependent enzyme [Bacillota bacterium]|nr:alanine/ornithine racemase family PLP-dependent enzyme [Bacillota bacterium]
MKGGSVIARLVVNLEAIRHNARLVQQLCSSRGMRLTAVTKGVLGDPVIVRHVISAGVDTLGDSRLRNILRMRTAGIRAEFHLIRAPSPAEIADVLWLADVSYHSEVEVIRALAQAAEAHGRTHRVVLMVDVGDRREGLMPEEVLSAAEAILSMKGVVLYGLGMNVGCVSGVLPSPTNMGLLVELAREIEARLGHRLELVSGGSSAAIPLLLEGRVPAGINHLRMGTAIWLGDYNTWDEPVPGARHDAFELVAPVIELKWKPSLPEGEVGLDAFGRRPVFEDRGPMLRVICGLGRQDVYVEGIQPRLPGLRVVGASSDHLILDATAAESTVYVGQEIPFRLNYGALLYAMQSPCVRKEYVGAGAAPPC